MGNCCKSSTDSRSLLKNAPAPESAAQASGAYSTAGVKTPSAAKKHEGFLDWGEENEDGAKADIKALEWLNFVVKEIWPFVDEALKTLIKEQIEPQMKEDLPTPLKGLHFSRCSLGTNVPVLGPVHVHKGNNFQRLPGVEIDVGLVWDCESDIEVQVMTGVSVGIKRLRISGTVCLVLRPLMKSMPIVGGLQIFMLSPPQVDWDFTGVGNFADFPCVSSTLRNVFKHTICEQLVLPHRLFIHWVGGRENEIDLTAMQFPVPEGLLRLCVVEAQGLDGKDWSILSKSTSDPYAVTHIGDRSFQTPTKKGTCDPKWGDEGWADFFIFSRFQNVSIELFDDDCLPRGDDFLGRVQDVSIRDIVKKGNKAWYPLTSSSSDSDKEKGHPAGKVRLALQAFEFRSEVSLVQAPPAAKGKADTKALLHVQLRALRGLPPEKSTGVIVVLHVGKQSFCSEGSTFVEVQQDFVYDQHMKAIDPAAQRMAEFLSTKDKLPVDQIAQIAGLDQHSLTKVLRERPSFTTRWNQGFNILLDDVTSSAVQIDLHHHALLGKEKDPSATLETPFQVKDLLKEKDMTWEGLLDLKHPAASKKKTSTLSTWSNFGQLGKSKSNLNKTEQSSTSSSSVNSSPGVVLDLDISFSLFGLQPV